MKFKFPQLDDDEVQGVDLGETEEWKWVLPVPKLNDQDQRDEAEGAKEVEEHLWQHDPDLHPGH